MSISRRANDGVFLQAIMSYIQHVAGDWLEVGLEALGESLSVVWRRRASIPDAEKLLDRRQVLANNLEKTELEG